MRQAPSVNLQLPIQERTWPDVISAFRHQCNELRPCLSTQQPILFTLQDAPAHLFPVVIINLMLLKEVYDIKIHRLFVTHRLLIAAIHKRSLIGTIIEISCIVYMHNFVCMKQQPDGQMKIFAISCPTQWKKCYIFYIIPSWLTSPIS